MQLNNKYKNINQLIFEMTTSKDKNLARNKAILLANEILLLLGANKEGILDIESVYNTAFASSEFKNQKMEGWFERHPFLGGARVALKLYNNKDSVYESNFYQLTKSATKARIASTVMLSPNWEDSRLTMLPNYKVGIDFFLTHDAKSLLIVLSKEGNLRVLEISERLSNTQITIFESLYDTLKFDGLDIKTGKPIPFEPQRTIHAKLWNAFELKVVNNKFYFGVARHFEELVSYISKQKEFINETKTDVKTIQYFANRLIGRVLFLWFLRKKEVISEEFKYFKLEDLESSEYYNERLKVLFFEVLNKEIKNRDHKDNITPYLNGGLFEIHHEDFYDYNIPFPKLWFNSFYGHLNEFNFTTDESTPEYEQIAIDPEMLGRVFENLLANIVPETSKTARDSKGAFYTPREIVDFMCKESLKYYLKNNLNNEAYDKDIEFLIDSNDAKFEERKSSGTAKLWGVQNKKVEEEVIKLLSTIKIIDPAAGSGAFPMGMMQLLLRTFDRLNAVYDEEKGKHVSNLVGSKGINKYFSKLGIIQNSIFGIDIEPMAVEISRLRIWLSLVVDDTQEEVKPLPNLDFNFVSANSLIPLNTNKKTDFEVLDMFGFMPENIDLEEKYKKLRRLYFKTHNFSDKIKLRKEFDLLLHEMANKENASDEMAKLATWNPFDISNVSSFFDANIMFNNEKFNLVIGNPPYIGEKGNKEIFDLVKSTSFGDKYYIGKMDYFYFFFHKGIDLLKDDGILSFITTNYYTTADGATVLRKDFYERTTLLKLINMNEITVFESARGQHDMITFLKKGIDKSVKTKQISVDSRGVLDSIELTRVLSGESDYSSKASVERKHLFSNIKEKQYYIRFSSKHTQIDNILIDLYSVSPKLGEVATINQGLISGADSFSPSHARNYPNIDAKPGEGIFIHPKGNLEKLGLQKEMIVPLFKNSDIDKWNTNIENNLELFYSDSTEEPSKIFLEYFKKYKPYLENRTEFKNNNRIWYGLHRAREKNIFMAEKLVAPQRNRTNKFAYNNSLFFASADVYFITKHPKYNFAPYYLLGILNSKLIYTWLYYRGKRKGDMLELYFTPLSGIPIKVGSSEEQRKLNTLVRKIVEDNSILDSEKDKIERVINEIVFDIYGLSADDRKAINEFYASKH